MPTKKNICLTISAETKQQAQELAEKLNISVSDLFSRLMQNVKIYDFNTIPELQINEILKQLNAVENHLYLIRKTLFEMSENNADIKSIYEVITKKYLEECHKQITEQAEKINEFILELNNIKKDLKNL
ncbi:hypothetical protein KA977_04065 [Candidatus Dependentiae bacterium]|nr:hypothetical protein [Candidatus Dependentiae bacterium]